MATDSDIFKIKHNNLHPGKGSILIAEPFLQDAYFQRAVVLLIEHNLNGTMGFVLNKKTDLVINDFFPDLEKLSEIPIYLGGPIGSNRLFFIHTLGDLIPNSVKISDGLYFDGDFDTLKQYMIHERSIAGKAKFFLGYSGWAQGQLGSEIKGDAWIVSHSINAHIMSSNDETFWRRSMEVMGKKYKTWINFPKDPYLN